LNQKDPVRSHKNRTGSFFVCTFPIYSIFIVSAVRRQTPLASNIRHSAHRSASHNTFGGWDKHEVCQRHNIFHCRSTAGYQLDNTPLPDSKQYRPGNSDHCRNQEEILPGNRQPAISFGCRENRNCANRESEPYN
jgi:hypothetical protein